MAQNRPERINLLLDYKFDAPLVTEAYEGTPYVLTEDTKILFNLLMLEFLQNANRSPLQKPHPSISVFLEQQLNYFNYRCPPDLRVERANLTKSRLSRALAYPKIVTFLQTVNQEIYHAVENQRNIGYVQQITGEILILVQPEGWFRITIDRETYDIPKDYLLMIFTRSLDSMCMLLMAHLASGVEYSSSFFDNVIEIFTYIHKQFAKKGTKMIALTKALEALCVGTVIRREDDRWFNDEFLRKTLEDLDEERIDARDLQALIERLPSMEILEVAEMGKLFGHPFISGEEGITKLATRVMEEKTIDLEYLWMSRNLMVRDWCKGHLKKYGHWPEVQLSDRCSETIQLAIRRNLWVTHPKIMLEAPIVNLADWAQVTPGASLEFDIKSNLVPLLKDRAIAVSKSKAVRAYIHKRGVPWKDKKVLLRFLSLRDAGADLANFCHLYSIAVTAISEDLVIKLTRKEGELKKEGRWFGQTTFLNRCRMQTIEENAKQYLSIYCPNQAMTPGDLELLKKFHAFARIRSESPRFTTIYYKLDTSGWNNAFRDESFMYTAEVLNNIFDTKMWLNMMHAFEQTHFYAPTKNSCYAWAGQNAGIEGLHQYSWVIMYEYAMRLALERLGLSYFTMVKGDDWIAAVQIPVAQIQQRGMEEINDWIKGALDEATRSIGQKMNKIESFSSEKLISFSKEFQLNDLWGGSLLKKGAKIHPFSNAILPTKSESIGAIYSNAHSCSGKTTNPLTSFIAAVVIAMWFITIFENLSLEGGLQLLSVPNVLGGAPVFYLEQMMVRAENDHLSSGLAFLKYLGRARPSSQEWIMAVFNQRLSSKFQPERLLIDIYSLPLLAPPRAFNIIRRFITVRVMNLVKDRNLRDLFKQGSHRLREEFCSTLLMVRPFFLKVLSAVYNASHFALLDDIVSIFESTQTIFQLFAIGRGAERAERVLRRAALQDERWWSWFINLQNQPSQHRWTWEEIENRCPTGMARFLRKEAYGEEPLGITYPPFTEFIEKISRNWYDLVDEEDRRYFLGIACNDPLPQTHGASEHFAICAPAMEPFLGHTTASKLDQAMIQLQKTSQTLTRVIHLLQVYAFTKQVGSNFNEQIVLPVLRTYTNIPADTLVPFAPTKTSGSSTHRLRHREWRAQISPNERPNRYNLATMISTTHDDFRADVADLNINFLHTYCHEVNIMLFTLLLGPTLGNRDKGRWYFVTTTCEECIEVVDDSPMTAPKPVIFPPIFHKNPYMTLTNAELAAVARDIEAAIYRKAIAKARVDPLLDPNTDLRVKVAISREALCLDFLAEAARLRAATGETAVRRTSANVVLPLLDDSFEKPNMRTIRAIPPITWVQSLTTTLADFVLAFLHTSEPEHALLHLPGIAYSEYPYFPLFETFRDAWVLPLLLQTCAQEYLVSIPYSAYDSAGVAQQVFARAGLSRIDLKQAPLISIWGNAALDRANHLLSIRSHRIRIHFAFEVCQLVDGLGLFPPAIYNAEEPELVIEEDDRWVLILPFLLTAPDLIPLSLEDLEQDSYSPFNEASFTLEHLVEFPAAIHGITHSVWKRLTTESWERCYDSSKSEVNARRVEALFTQENLEEAVHFLADFSAEYSIPLQVTHKLTAENIVRENPSAAWLRVARREGPTPRNAPGRPLTACPIQRDSGFAANWNADPCDQPLPVPDDPPSEPQRSRFQPHYIYRAVGGAVSSASKLWEILCQLGLVEWVRNQRLNLCLADGAGGYASLLAFLQPRGHSYVVTLHDKPGAPQEGSLHSRLSEAANWGEVNHVTDEIRVHDLGDLREDATVEFCIANYYNTDILTMDAEGIEIEHNPGYGILMQNVFKIIDGCVRRGGLAIIKTFLTNTELLPKSLGALNSLFQHLHICKPRTSADLSGEVFLVGMRKVTPHHVVWDYPPAQLVDYATAVIQDILTRRARCLEGYPGGVEDVVLEVLPNSPDPARIRLQAIGINTSPVKNVTMIEQIKRRLRLKFFRGVKEELGLIFLGRLARCSTLIQVQEVYNTLREEWIRTHARDPALYSTLRYIIRLTICWRLLRAEFMLVHQEEGIAGIMNAMDDETLEEGIDLRGPDDEELELWDDA